MDLVPTNYLQATVELSKAFSIAKDGHKLEMFSGALDAVWHDLVARDDLTYANLCDNFVGADVIHHQEAEEGLVTFIPEYERRFGPLPLIWFLDERWQFQSAQHAEYTRLGTVHASWNCRPLIGPMANVPKKESDDTKPSDEKPSKAPPPEDTDSSTRGPK